MTHWIKSNFHVFLFLLTFFIFQLPPFYPFLTHAAYVNSHSIARYFLIFLFLYTIIKIYKKKFSFKFNLVNLSVVIFFASQSLSIINAVNIESFLSSYIHLVFGIFFFITGLHLINNGKKASLSVVTLLVTVGINLIFKYFIYFQQNTFMAYIKPNLYEPYAEVVINYLYQNKFFMDIFDPAMTFLLLYSLFKYKKIYIKIIVFIMLLFVILFSILSNFRTHIIMLLFSIFAGSLIVVRNKHKFLYLSISIFAFFFLLLISYTRISSTTSIERLSFSDKPDKTSVTSRITMWQTSIDMSNAYPLTGVGLGNFYDKYPTKTNFRMSVLDWKNITEKSVLIDPHNIFFSTLAQSGMLGFASFLLMLIVFILKDYSYLKNGQIFPKVIVVCFWSLFIFSLLNPALSMEYVSLFWLFRVLLGGEIKYS